MTIRKGDVLGGLYTSVSLALTRGPSLGHLRDPQ